MILDKLPEWSDYMNILQDAERVLDKTGDLSDPQKRQEAYRLLFSAVASGYHSAFADPRYPDFVPVVSNILNTIGANPDFVYGYTQLDGQGAYRLSGFRGDEVFVVIDLTAGGLGVLDALGPSVGFIDLDTLNVATDGSFDVLLSAERPADYSGDWFELNPDTKTAAFRKAYYHWGAGNETRLVIERLDSEPSGMRMDAGEVSRRLNLLSEYVSRYVQFVLGYGDRLRAQGFTNQLEYDDWAGKGGLPGQHYYQGLYELKPGEALILESALPEKVRYWNVQLNDSLWNSIDWFAHQCSLNGAQAKLDDDRKFRAVISPEDPGVANWLDTGGHLQGSLMLRWTQASSGPEPSLTKVQLADLRRHLPQTTPIVTPQQREVELRMRNRSAQLRRRW
jgi:hypothetical protein